MTSLEEFDRFRLLRELGRGGMGVVSLVDDRLRGQVLALKRMRSDSSVNILRIKHEYRSIESIVHPNILAVYELGQDTAGPYFLMEAVTGVPLCEFCRGSGGSGLASTGPQADPGESLFVHPTPATTGGERGETGALPPLNPRRSLDDAAWRRTFAALSQLLAALDCLHQHDLVHRDLKPSNVLVRTDGVLKLLDFGILGEAGSDAVGTMQGTAAYVAPEQARGEAPVPASDMYSLGVMLFEIVTGHLPFNAATSRDLLLQHLGTEPVPVRTLAPTCPEWLARAIHALLHKDPNRRLTLQQLGALCAAHVDGFVAVPQTARPAELVEREEETQRLLALLNDDGHREFTFVALCGASGLGKSELLRWTRRAVRRRRLTVLESRTRFSERIAFNAIDGIVDGLAWVLDRFPELSEDPAGRALLEKASAMFPVLARALGQGKPLPLARLEPKSVFDAVIALLERCTKITGRLVILCDDLQWADADSVLLLQRLMSARPPNILLVATVRDDTHTEAFANLWAEVTPDVRIALKRLSEQALVEIIEGVAADAGRFIEHATARAAALACDGRPLLAMVSGRVAGRTDVGTDVRPIAWLLGHDAPRGSEERRLLSFLAAIDGDAHIEQLARLTKLAPAAIDVALTPIVLERLMVAAGRLGDQRSYRFSHDLVRQQVLELNAGDEMRESHASLADDLEATGARPAQLVRHLLGAGRFERAAEVAVAGAKEARQAKAFGLAVELYDIAIEHFRGDSAPLRQARATALERLGRFSDAAAEWKKLADDRSGDARAEALLSQAKALLASNRIVEGRNAFALARSGRRERTWLPETWLNWLANVRATWGPWAVPGRSRMTRTKPRASSGDRPLVLGSLICYVEPFAGVRDLLRTRAMYRDNGNRDQAAEVEYVLSYLRLWSARRRGDLRGSRLYLESARSLFEGGIRPEHGNPYALDLMIQGITAIHEGQWQAAREILDRGIACYNDIGGRGSFASLVMWLARVNADRLNQDVGAWATTLAQFQRETDDGVNSAIRPKLGFSGTRLAVARGDAAEARRIALQTLETWPQDEPSLERFFTRLNLVVPYVLEGDLARARRDLQEAVAANRKFLPTRDMEAADVLGHLAYFEAAAVRRNESGASLSRIRRWARQSEVAVPFGHTLALRSAAYALDYVGKPERAIAWLERAERAALQVDQPVDAAIAQYQRGLRIGGDMGLELRRRAEQTLLARGAHARLLNEDPARR